VLRWAVDNGCPCYIAYKPMYEGRTAPGARLDPRGMEVHSSVMAMMY
jgi:hypothetical protein